METHLITGDMPVGMLTVDQFKDMIYDCISRKESIPVPQTTGKEYVTGLSGIRRLFGVSHPTAQRFKDTFLKPAISQVGRVITVDVAMARDLFDKYKENQ